VNGIYVFNDPTTEQLVVVNDGAMAPYVITDLQGKQLITGSLTSGRNELHLSGLASGAYLLHTTAKGGSTTARFVVY
jgi:hypothetical protein